MTDADLAGLKIAVEHATVNHETTMWLPVALAARLAAEVEARGISHHRLLEAAGAVLAVIGKWRSGEIDAQAAMQAINGTVDAWDGGKA